MKTLLTVFLISLFAVGVVAQVKLPSNFTFSRVTGQTSGLPGFLLGLAPESIEYDLLKGNEFEALTATLQPERDVYVLVFVNCKTQLSLRKSISKGATLAIDGEKIKIPKYRLKGEIRRKALKVGVEIAEFDIDKRTFVLLVNADDVTVQVGSVMYNLDEDNLLALRYLAFEVNKDLKRRGKPIVE